MVKMILVGFRCYLISVLVDKQDIFEFACQQSTVLAPLSFVKKAQRTSFARGMYDFGVHASNECAIPDFVSNHKALLNS